MAFKTNYDWEALERDYRTGRYTLDELSSLHGPSKSTIHKKAKQNGWEKDLTGAVQARTRQKVAKAAVPEDVLEQLGDDERAIVEQAANVNALVVTSHRKHLTRWKELLDQYTDRLSDQLAQERITIQTPSGDPFEIDIPLDYIGKNLTAGTQALDRVIRLERQSYGLDEEVKDEPPETKLTDEQVRARIQELEAKRKARA